MKADERVAEAYLKHRGFAHVVFEPEGKSKPPDFLVDGKIAVEVRRLNQHEAITPPGARPRGLEELAIPLWHNFQKLLASLGPPTAGVSWYVDISYHRPVPDGRPVQRAVARHLRAFRNSPTQQAMTINVFPSLTLKLFPAGPVYADCFVFAGAGDRDAGGFVTPELERNIGICIDDKTAKTASTRAKYREWWLVLLDHINYARKEALQVPPHNWDKIILINPLDHTQAVEL